MKNFKINLLFATAILLLNINIVLADLLCLDNLKSVYSKYPIVGKIVNDQGLLSKINSLKSQLEVSGQINPPIKMSTQMKSFRKKFLPFIKLDELREPLVRWMEAELRIKSNLVEQIIFKGDIEQKYDIVIIGSGVHGIVAAQAALATNPKLRILIVDESDTAGSTFRYADQTFNINSSNRASSEEALPLPGRGNINELPGFPIQVSDLSGAKYPSAGDLGSSLVAGLYSTVSEYKNVDVLFNTKVKSLFKTSNIGRGKYVQNLEINNARRNRTVSTQRVIVASGLGRPNYPKNVLKRLESNPVLTQSKDISKVLPQVLSFEDVMRVLAQSNNPKKYFENKTVAVVGTGDSANVFIEFLLGYGPRQGYGFSDAQTLGVKKIYWIGQDKNTCNEFIKTSRSRYSQIGTGYRSSDPNASGLIDADSRKVDDLRKVTRTNTVELLNSDRSLCEVDHVIFTTGFKGELRSLFEKYFTEKASDGTIIDLKEAYSEEEFLKTHFDFLELKTRTSEGRLTRAGIYAKKPNFIITDSKEGISEEVPSIVLVGPGAGRLPMNNELVGIIQNTVSIFNNAPRSAASAKFIASDISAISASDEGVQSFMVGKKSTPSKYYEIDNLSETRSLGSATEAYLKTVTESVFSKAEFRDYNEETIIRFTSRNGKILARQTGNLNLQPILSTLADTRDYFNQLNQLLSFSNNLSYLIKVDPKSPGQIVSFFGDAPPTTTKIADSEITKIDNEKIKLRGID